VSTHDVVRDYVERLEARDWPAFAALLDPDVVYEMPQTRERVRGRERYLQFNQEYPGEWHLEVLRVVAEDLHGVCWLRWRVGEEAGDAVVLLTVDDDGLVTEVVDFWPESYEPPPGRDHLVERW